MRFFIDLILFSCILIKSSSSDYILCTSQCSQLTVSFFEPLRLPVECRENGHIYDYALVCTIDYRIDYDAKSVYINFKAINDTNTFKDSNQSEFLIQTVWLGFNQESSQPNLTHRKYGCNTRNDCARSFYLNTVEHLITNGKLQLDKIHSKLYKSHSSIDKSTSFRCKDSNKTGKRSWILCKNGLCYARNLDIKQYCTKDITPTLFSEIEYHLPKSITDERELIEYKCNRNLCNKNQTMESIKKHLRDYTNWYDVTQAAEKTIGSKSSTIHRTGSYWFIIAFIFILRI